MKDILWLASWYPNKRGPYNGDFLERHAKAASLYNKVTVLFVIKDHHSGPGNYFIEERKYNDNLSARILYYKPFSRIGAIDSLFSGIKYCSFFSMLIRQYITDKGKPDLVHVQVAWRAGLMALYCKWRYKLKYVISEQWTVFMPNASPGFKDRNFFVRKAIKRIYKNASAYSSVSEQLADALQNRFHISKPSVIPNVVDASVFRPTHVKKGIFRFIHVSEFNYQKNPEQLFEAISLLKAKTEKHFELLVFAPHPDAVNALARKYSVEDVVRSRNYVPHEVLSREMSHSDTLVLYSRYETFGCVVIEAMASGIPVIVSDIPVMHEIVTANTGVLVPSDAPVLLAERMLWMMENRGRFDRRGLTAYVAENYSFERVGRLFDRWYDSVQ